MRSALWQPAGAAPALPEASRLALEDGAAVQVEFLRSLLVAASEGRVGDVVCRVPNDARGAVAPVVTAAAAAATAAMHPDAKLGTCSNTTRQILVGTC